MHVLLGRRTAQLSLAAAAWLALGASAAPDPGTAGQVIPSAPVSQPVSAQAAQAAQAPQAPQGAQGAQVEQVEQGLQAAQARAAPTLQLPDPATKNGAIRGFGLPIAAGVLDSTRGGAATTINDTRLAGAVSGNSAVQVVTGANVIQAGSFADASGIPIVIQNSGANVLIQNATVINLKVD